MAIDEHPERSESNRRNIALPPGLPTPVRKAAEAILKVARDKLKRDPYTGGCRTFYTPEEWKVRGELYGLNSALIVVYDGGEIEYFFDWDRGILRYKDAIDKALEEAGFYVECCTCWYSAIYPL